jgi:hypothetical protein
MEKCAHISLHKNTKCNSSSKLTILFTIVPPLPMKFSYSIPLTCSFDSTSNWFLPYTHTHTHTNLCHVIFFSNPLCLCTRIISTSPLSPLLCITMLTLPCRHLQLLLCLHINQMAKKYFEWCITPKLIIWFANFLCYTSFLLHIFMLLFFCWVLDLNFYLFIDELSFESPKMIWKHIQKRLYTQTQNISNPIHAWIDSKLKHNSLH